MLRNALLAPCLFLAACAVEPTPPELANRRAALGEPLDGFPNGAERELLYLTNRARLAPTDAALCGRGFDVPPVLPLEHNLDLAHAARFHAREMARAPCFQHDSCGFVLGTRAAACSSAIPPEAGGACAPGAESYCAGYDEASGSCSATCPLDERLTFGVRARALGYPSQTVGENIAGGYESPREAFCAFFLEGPEPSPPDGEEHGHFENIVASEWDEVGHGVWSETHAICESLGITWSQDFGSRGVPRSIIPSASSWRPPGALPLVFGAIWNDSGPPLTFHVAVDGRCTSLALAAGSLSLGAFEVPVQIGAGCHAYHFVAVRPGGEEVTYPSVGDLVVGDGCDRDYQVARASAACTRPCVPDAPCLSPTGCALGTSDCSTGVELCVGLAPVADGDACGESGTCASGSCLLCDPGARCADASGCRQGTVACPAGTASCEAMMDVADGTPCAPGGVCFAGTCSPCAQGALCDDSGGDPCRKGVTACDSGQPVCERVGVAPDGVSCGQNLYCSLGRCTPCRPDIECTGGQLCKTGAVSCATGLPECEGFVDRPDGTPCLGARICAAGECVECEDGARCFVGDGCRQGAVRCAAGGICEGLDAVADGMPCPGGSCLAGRCAPPATSDAGQDAPPESGCGCANGSRGSAPLAALLLLWRRRYPEHRFSQSG